MPKDILLEHYHMTELHLLELYGEELKRTGEDLSEWDSITDCSKDKSIIMIKNRLQMG